MSDGGALFQNVQAQESSGAWELSGQPHDHAMVTLWHWPVDCAVRRAWDSSIVYQNHETTCLNPGPFRKADAQEEGLWGAPDASGGFLAGATAAQRQQQRPARSGADMAFQAAGASLNSGLGDFSTVGSSSSPRVWFRQASPGPVRCLSWPQFRATRAGSMNLVPTGTCADGQ